MAGIPGLDVYEVFEPEPGRAVSLRPGSTAQRVPNTALATRPYQPNWTVPPPAAPAALPAPGPTAMQPDMRRADALRAANAARRAGPVPAPSAPSTPAGNAAQRAWRSLRGGAQQASVAAGKAGVATGKASLATGKLLARGGLPALAGAGLAMADDAIEASRPAPEPFVAPPAQPGDIPVDTSLRAPAAVPERSPLGFGPNNELTRNLAAAANAVPGLGIVRNASLGRTGAAAFGAAETGRRTAQALTAAQAAQQVVRGAQAAQGAPEATSAAVAPTGEVPQADYSNEGNNNRTPFRTPNDGEIVRNGNAYSGTGPIKFGADIVNKDGSLRTGGFGVSSLDTSEGLRQDQLELQRNAAARAEQESNQQAQLAAALEAGRTDGYGILGKDYQRERSIKMVNGPRARFAAAERESMRAQDAAKEVASLREQGETARNVNTNTTLRDNTAADIALRRRGQDLVNDLGYAELDTREKGFRATARTAAEKAAQDAFYKERDFQTGRADADFTQRGQRETQLQKKIEDLTTTTDKDGKPMVDVRRAREFRSGLERSVARAGGKSLADLDQADEQKLFAASDLLKVMKENSGMMPWKPKALETIDPIDLTGLRVLSNGDRQITRADSKAAGQIIPARFFQTEEGTRFFGGTPTNRFDMLSEEQ